MGLVNFIRRARKEINPLHVRMEVSQIAPQVFLGTNACCRAHYQLMLIDQGIGHDISLEGEQVDMPYGAETYLWLPTEDHEAPTMRSLELGVEYINNVIVHGGKVFVHCKNGHGRSPTLVAAWLMRQGKSLNQSLLFLKRKRPEIHLEPSQLRMLEKFGETLGAS